MANIAIQRVAEASAPPLALFQTLEKQMEQVRKRAFEIFETRGRELGHDIEDWIRAEHEITGWPAAELAEENGAYKLEMTLAGFDPKQVEVVASPDEIVVHAEIRGEKKPEGEHVLWTEFGPNNVTRRFRLPTPIDVNKTKAALEHGLLKITATRASGVKTTPILVAAA